MSHHFFAVPALDSAAAHDEFNAFCTAHRVLLVDDGERLAIVSSRFMALTAFAIK